VRARILLFRDCLVSRNRHHERDEGAMNKRRGLRKVPIRELNGPSVVFLCPPEPGDAPKRDNPGARDLDMEPIGRTRWAIAEGYIPSRSSFSEPALVSHETACILNAGDRQAHVDITLFFADREPVGPYRVTISPRRTLHLRFNDLEEPAAVPRDTDFSSVFEADVPIIVQHTRLDSRHAEVSLLSTTAYAEA
jgi:hypothetical protein